MKPDELKIILEKHKEWIETVGEGGERASLWRSYLERADLRGADLQGANLWHADLRQAELQDANLQDANLVWADLQEADLRGTNFQEADLREANLRGADFDFSCFPLWCGGAHFKADVRLLRQLAAHMCTLECDDTEWLEVKETLLPFAKKSHRADDLGLIKDGK